MTIGQLMLSGFTISAPVRILLYLGLEVGNGDEVVIQYEGYPAEKDIPFDLMTKAITAINVTDDGWLEIEYVDEDLF